MPISARNQLALLLCSAVLLGGGGVAYGLMNLAVQLIALALLAANRKAFVAFWTEAPRPVAILVALTIALPLLQMVPLPPGWWHALPGRELAVEARKAVGADGWYGLTLDRNRTLVAVSGLLAPLCLLVLAWRLSFHELERTGRVLLALAMINFLLGVPQVLSNGEAAILYPEIPMPGVLFGTFANRNSTGIFLVTCLAMLALPLGRSSDGKWQLARAVLGILLVVAIVLTRSRSAIVLMAFPLGLLAWRYVSQTAEGAAQGTARRKAAIGIILAIIAGIGLLTASSTRIGDSLERFSAQHDARAFIWDDAAHAAHRYWPAGAGMGTFDEVFQADESLENLTLRRAGRAHNDYLEVAIEAGLPGILLIAAWLASIGWLMLAARSSPHRWSAWTGACALAAIALQSTLDYPLRSQAMLCTAAFAFALLARAALVAQGRQP